MFANRNLVTPRTLSLVDPDGVARAARLGVQIDRLVPGRRAQTALLVSLGRVTAGFTQHELGGLLGVSRSTIARIETGRTNLTPALAVALADELNLDPELLETHD